MLDDEIPRFAKSSAKSVRSSIGCSRPVPDLLGKRCASRLATEADCAAQAVCESGAWGTLLTMPLDGGAFRGVEIAIEIADVLASSARHSGLKASVIVPLGGAAWSSR
jgi:hypothetical protein